MGLSEHGLELLDVDECIRLLGTAEIGRVGLAEGEVAAVLPVNFTLIGTEIFFFTGAGLKLSATTLGRTASFEADDFDRRARSGWSVLAVGQLAPANAGARDRAQALGLYPWAAGDRAQLVRLRPDFWSGRRILTG